MSDLEKDPIDEVLTTLNTSHEGLSQEEAKGHLTQYGYNELETKKAHPVLKFLKNFWGPVPWMIEIAAILSAFVHSWVDLIIILILLLFNATIGFWQEHQASNAIEALKKKLALKATVKRGGKWESVEARSLVPGDVIRVKMGEILPADIRLIEGDYLSVDQSALTGESLPVSKKVGDGAYSGSVASQGEMVGVVYATGNTTYLGKTARLVSEAKPVSHFQKAVLHIGDYLIYLSASLAVILVVVQLARGDSWLTLLQFALILVVAAIPVAMPAVLSMTMAVGALALAKMKAIVTRLESIEEMAGMDVLCSDKTGTLTQNKLKLGDPTLFEAKSPEELVLAASLASNLEDPDPIDAAILSGVTPTDYKQTSFTPFDPVSKQTKATIQDPQGNTFEVAKGAPQVILDLCKGADDTRYHSEVNRLAAMGYRTLGVAKKTDSAWQLLGLISLFDPPREDSAETILQAKKYGVTVKMVTGDNVAIAKEISGQLGLGTDIEAADTLFEGEEAKAPSEKVRHQIEEAGGFAQVLPEHKYGVVKALQQNGHIVGMTGDGVNDAPALKQADTGIAVSGATDAARAAAALVLTAPGLSVIVRAVEEARQIFERMNSYAMYRITETIRIMFFVVLAMLAFGFYPITAVMIILLAFFNDLPIMTIAYDNTWLDPKPVKWEMRRILSVSTVLGLIGVVETFAVLVLGRLWLKFDDDQIRTLIFLKLTIAGHLTLFVVRTQKAFYTRPYPAQLMLWSAIGTKAIVTLLAGFGWGLVTPIPWTVIGYVWIYCLAWVFIEDWTKLGVYHHLRFSSPHHLAFLHPLKRHAHAPSA